MHGRTFTNREAAGRQLGNAVRQHVHLENPLILGLAPGGVPVAAEIARALDAELFVVDVRTQRDPSKPDVAICAFGQDEEPVLRADTAMSNAAAVVHSRPSLAAPEVKCHNSPHPCNAVPDRLYARDVLVVDDSLAASTTMLTAIRAVKACGAHRIVVAAPIGDPGVCALVSREADRVICPLQPPSLGRVDDWYDDFTRLTDADVCAIAEASHRARRLSLTSRLAFPAR
jgi:putative phosphoribosyl transferase